MKKFEIYRKSVNVRYKNRKDIKQQVALMSDNEVELIMSCETLEDAMKEFGKYKKTEITECRDAIGIYYEVEEFYIEENECGEDDEYIECKGILEISKINIELTEIPGYKTIGTFDNMADVVEAERNYEGENEVRISY